MKLNWLFAALFISIYSITLNACIGEIINNTDKTIVIAGIDHKIINTFHLRHGNQVKDTPNNSDGHLCIGPKHHCLVNGLLIPKSNKNKYSYLNFSFEREGLFTRFVGFKFYEDTLDIVFDSRVKNIYILGIRQNYLDNNKQIRSLIKLEKDEAYSIQVNAFQEEQDLSKLLRRRDGQYKPMLITRIDIVIKTIKLPKAD